MKTLHHNTLRFLALLLLTAGIARADVSITFHPNIAYNSTTGVFTNNVYYINWSKTESYTDSNNNSATRNEVRVANADGTWNPSGTLLHSDNYGAPASGTATGNFEYANRKFAWRVYTQNTVAGTQTITYTSGSAEYSGTPPENKKLRLKYDNTAGVATMQVLVMKDGQQYGSTYEVAPGTLWSTTLENVPDGSYSLLVKVKDWVQSEAGTWTQSVGGAQLVSTTSVPTTSINTAPTDAQIVQPPTPAPPSVPSAVTPTAGSVWRTGSGNVTTDGLTNAVFREGIDKITERQDKQVAYQKKLDDKQTADKTALDANTENVVKTAALAAGNATTSSIQSTFGNTSVTPGASGGTSSMSIALAGTGITANLAPWDDSTLHTVAQIIKGVIAAFVFIGYCKWQAARFKEYMATLSIAPQARGNTVAGTGGQVTALISAVTITFILVTAPVAFVALADTGLGWGTTVNIFGGLASNAIGKMGFDILTEFVPVDTIVTSLSGQLVTLIAGTAICTGFAAAIRYVIPALAILCALATPNEANADVSVKNQSAETVSVFNGATTTNVAAGATAAVPYIGASLFTFSGASIEDTRREVLDNAIVDYHGDFSIAVTFPASVWWVYVVKGFVVGCLFELAGMAIRFLGRATASVETV